MPLFRAPINAVSRQSRKQRLFRSVLSVNPTTATFAGPLGGVSGAASTNFTLAFNRPWVSGSGTLSDGGAGGTFIPTTINPSAGATAFTFTYTPTSVGAKTITPTLSGITIAPTTLTYTATAVTATVATLSGPSTGVNGSASTQFTISPVSGVWPSGATIAIAITGVAATISPSSSLTPTAGSSAPVTFTITPNGVGNATITPTAAGITFSPVNLVYASTASVPVIATQASFTGTSTGTVGVASTFTISPTNGVWGSGVSIALALSGASGTFTPASLSPVGGTSTPATFTFTPNAVGNSTITPTAAGITFVPVSLSVTASNAAPTTATFTGPLTGVNGLASTNFTLTFNRPWVSGTGTLSDGAGGGTFTPTTINPTPGQTTFTFTYTPSSTGAKTITPTISGIAITPTNLTYTATAIIATAASFSGPSTATVGSASTVFTVTPTNGVWGTGVSIALGITGAGGAASPPALNPVAGTSNPVTFTLTPSSAGSTTITPTAAGITFAPTSIAVTATNAITTPEAFTGLQAWYRPDGLVVSGNNVTSWTEARGTAGRNLTAQPAIFTNNGPAFNGFQGAYAPAGGSMAGGYVMPTTTNFTTVFCGSFDTSGFISFLFNIGGDGGFWPAFNSNQFIISGTTNAIPVPNGLHVFTVARSGGFTYFSVDGLVSKIPFGAAVGGNVNLSGLNNLLEGTVLEHAYSTTFEDYAKLRIVQDTIAAKYGVSLYKSAKNNIVYKGDSITFGFPTGNSISFATFVAGINGYNTSEYVNFGVSAQTVTSANNDPQSDGLNYCGYAAQNPIYVLWMGTNDLANGDTPANTYTNFVQLCGKAKARGFAKVLVLTVIARDPANTNATAPNFEANRQAFNTLLRNTYLTFADGLVDVGADTLIGAPGTYANGTYFSDGVHLTAFGGQYVASLVAPALVALGASGPPSVVPTLTLTAQAGANFTLDTSTLAQYAVPVDPSIIVVNAS
jgi:lysophospholipase L1-like esterase